MDPQNQSRWSPIRFYQESQVSLKTRNRLPHWQQDEGTYFTTFRLADSLPSELLEDWRDERRTWLIQNPKPWLGTQELEYHRRFSSAIDSHLDDSHGACLLRDQANAGILADSFSLFDADRYLLHAWVIMPNHAHLLFSVAPAGALDKIIASWKRFSANQIQQRIGGAGGIWQKDYFDRLIRNEEHFQNVIRYIRNNPVKAKLSTSEYLHYQAPWA
jgi:REP element-mobilizing transposase RayT